MKKIGLRTVGKNNCDVAIIHYVTEEKLMFSYFVHNEIKFEEKIE